MNVIIWRKAELIPESDEVVLVFPSMGIVNIGEIFLIGKLILFPPPSRVRFPDMSCAYDATLRAKARAIAERHGIRIKEGVYVGTQGPTFETPAEYRFFRTIGGDAVGMSTVPEVIAAVHAGIRVFAMSIITDLGVEGKVVEVSHEEVQRIANSVQPYMTLIMKELIQVS